MPVNVAAATKDFCGGDGGVLFFSAGIGAGVPLKFVKGNWTFNVGATRYHTDKDAKGNPKSDFATGNAGLVLAF